MTDDMLDDKKDGSEGDITGTLVPTDPTQVAMGLEALRDFLTQVCAEEDCEWHAKQLTTLALEFGPEPEALRQRLADADALELHMCLLALHWGRGVLDDAMFNFCGNARLASMAQALHTLVVSGNALPRLPLLPAAGRRWRAEWLGVEALPPHDTELMRRCTRGKARRRVDALGRGQRVLMMLLADRRRGADWVRWKSVTVNLIGRYPERDAWSRAQLWARSEEELQALHVAVEDLRFVMDAAVTGLFAVSHRSLRCIRRVLAHWPSATQLFAEAQRNEAAAVWLFRWVGSARGATFNRSRRRRSHHTLYVLRWKKPRK